LKSTDFHIAFLITHKADEKLIDTP